MEFQQMKEELLQRLQNEQLVQATISQPRLKSNDIKRIKLKPLELKGTYHIQLEYQYERILKHENITLEDLAAKLDDCFEQFRQFQGEFIDEQLQIQMSKKK